MAIKSSNQITFTEQKKIVQIKEWYLATNKSADVTIETNGWTEEIQTIDDINRYLWNYEEVIYSLGSSDISDPIIIGFYGKGADGKGIADIKNYYLVTSIAELPENPEWSTTVTLLSPTDKYLWNYEIITYTDNTSKETEPAIIGAYGDSGADAVDFQIYSVDGFEFNETISAIELKTAAFKAGDLIESGATYQWKWWNADSDLEDKYEDIPGATSSILVVSRTDPYALLGLRCDLSYDGLIYSDHVVLTSKTELYTSIIKFFDGSNVFEQTKSYIIAYLEVYKNNLVIESKLTDEYYDGDNTISGSVINTDIAENEKMYFIHASSNGKYNVTLGQYNNGIWNVCETNNVYTYYNSLYPDNTSNIIVVLKKDISKFVELNFEVRQDGEFISRSTATIIDLNDPIVSDVMPVNVKYGQLWLDTSTNPYTLKIYTQLNEESNSGEWKYFSQQSGGSVYTTIPLDGYLEGDLWVISENDVAEYSGEYVTLFSNFGAGSMVKAEIGSSKFDESHWIDAQKDITNVITNVKESFTWDDNGIKVMKRVTDSDGNVTNPFYVNIDSTRMGFHSVEYVNGTVKNDIEVVHVGNNSSTIQNATFQGSQGTTFENNASFNGQVNMLQSGTNIGFTWKVEENGSLSLVVAS